MPRRNAAVQFRKARNVSKKRLRTPHRSTARDIYARPFDFYE